MLYTLTVGKLLLRLCLYGIYHVALSPLFSFSLSSSSLSSFSLSLSAPSLSSLSPSPLPAPLSTQAVENLPLDDPNLAVLITNSEYQHNLAESSSEGDKDYSSRRKTCEAISRKLGVQWLRDLKWEELEGVWQVSVCCAQTAAIIFSREEGLIFIL